MTAKKRFLFLQGVCSPFFPRLALALRAEGHEVRKVNFTVGDSVYWGLGNTTVYRDSMSGLSEFYRDIYRRDGITDLVLFGDCRPVHRPAIDAAPQHGIHVHVFEEGYFRPHWITLERDGVNGHSCLPKDPAWYKKEASKVPHVRNGIPVKSPFWKRAAYDVGYNFWAGLNPILHRGVRSHVPYSPLSEYLGYIRRGINLQLYKAVSQEQERILINESESDPFFLLPLQLATDAQITQHSPYQDMKSAMSAILESFATHAPSHTRIAAKIHPLDPGLVDYQAIARAEARRLGIGGRLFFLESGNLPELLTHTAGVVTVNSTVGASALIHERPTIALGKAIYDLPGLTYQEGLDKFWTGGNKPDIRLFHCFRDVVIDRCQINGGFYSGEAIRLGIQNALPRLTTSVSTN